MNDRLERFKIRAEWSALNQLTKDIQNCFWKIRSDLQLINCAGWDDTVEHRIQANKELLESLDVQIPILRKLYKEFGESVSLIRKSIPVGVENAGTATNPNAKEGRSAKESQ